MKIFVAFSKIASLYQNIQATMLTLHEFLISYLPDYNMRTCQFQSMPKVPSRKKARPQPKDNKMPKKETAVPMSRGKHIYGYGHPPCTLTDFVVGDDDAGTPSSSSPTPIGDVPEAVAPVGPQLQQSLVDAIKAGMIHLTTAIIEEQQRGMAEMKEAINVALQQPLSQSSAAVYVQQRGTAR